MYLVGGRMDEKLKNGSLKIIMSDGINHIDKVEFDEHKLSQK